MPITVRRPGVPNKPRETRFVTHLVDEGFGIAKPAHARISPEQLEGERKQAVRAADAAAWDAEIAAMTDDEFALHLASEGLTPDHFLADIYKAARK